MAPPTGTRLVKNCIFYSDPGLWSPKNFTITNCYFGDGIACSPDNPFWASFDGNFVCKTQASESVVLGDITNCFLLADPSPPSTPISFFLLGENADSNVTGNVCQSVGPTSWINYWFGETEGAGPDRTYTFKNNIILAPQGGGSMPLGGLDSNTSVTYTDYTVAEHNTICTNGMSSMNEGVVVGAKANTVLSLKSNIFYNANGVAGNYAFNNMSPTPTLDAMPAANADYNGWFGLSTVPIGTWNDIADGTVYNSPMSGSTPPGVHDVANVNPQFLDPTRDLQSWDASLGGPGTIASALARIQQDPTLTKSSLLPYIQTGFAPTNPAYKGTAADGGDIGAVPVVVPAQSSLIGIPASPNVSPSLQASQNVSQSVTFSVGAGAGGGAAAITIQTQKAVVQKKVSPAKPTVAQASPSSQAGVRTRNVPFKASRFRLLQSVSSLSTED